jgi:hypothetical protein
MYLARQELRTAQKNPQLCASSLFSRRGGFRCFFFFTHGILICLSGPGKLPAGVTRVAYGGHRCNMEDIADSKNCNLQFFEKTQKENKNQG